MSRFKQCALAAALSLALVTAAQAGDGVTYRFSGFGTVGYAATSSDDVELANPGQLNGAQKGGSGLVDSRIGGQLNVTFDDKWSATGQAIAQQDAKGRFVPTLEWAFVRYQLSDSVAIRAGRLGWPAYLVSDYRYVGYANPWLRAPLEVYGLAPLDYFEGADVTWSHDAGGGYLSVQVLGGHVSAPSPGNSERAARIKANQFVGAYATYEIGGLRLRGGLTTSKATFQSADTQALFGGLSMAGLDDVAQSLRVSNTRTTFASLGGNYDAHNVLVTAEYARLTSSGLIGHAHGWYATFGRRFGGWMPYLTWAGYEKRDERDRYTVPAVGPLLPLAAGVDQIAAGNAQHTVSAGLRWDVHSNIALKAQFDHVRPSAAGGTFVHVAPGYDGHPVNVVSAVVDFLF